MALGLLGALGIAATPAALAVANLVISLVLSKIFAPDIPEQKQLGSKTRVSPNTANKLPILYGVNRLGGHLVMASVTDDGDNSPMAFIIGFGHGEIEEFTNIYWGDKKLSFDDDITTDLRDVTDAVGPDGSDDFLNGNMRLRAYAAGGRCTHMEDFSENWNSSAVMTNQPYLYIELDYDQEEQITRLGNILAETKGRKVRTFDSSGNLSTDKTYSDNPGECTLDYVLDNFSGAGLDEEDVDISTFYTLKQFCDTTVTVTNVAGIKVHQIRYTCNGTVDTGRDVGQNISELMTCCQSTPTFDLGKLGALVNTTKSSTYSFDSKNIYGGVNLVYSDAKSTINELTVRYNSKIKGYTEDQITLERPKLNNEAVSELTVDLPFTNNNTEATINGAVIVNQAAQDISVEFKTDLRGLKIQAGDVVEVAYADYGWPTNADTAAGRSGKEFRVMRMEEIELPEGGLGVAILALEYSDEVYTVGSINQDDVAPNTSLVNPNQKPVISNIATTDASVRETNGLLRSGRRITWDSTISKYVNEYRISYKKSTDTNYSVRFAQVTDTILPDLESGHTYDIKIQGKTGLGTTGNEVSSTFTTSAFPQPPAPTLSSPASSSYSTNEAGGFKIEIKLDYTYPAEFPYPLQTSVEYLRTVDGGGVSTGETAFISAGVFDGNEAILSDVPSGTYSFILRSIDINGTVSDPNSSTGHSIVGSESLPKTPQNFSINAGTDTAALSWDLSTELDVRQGGAVEIRVHPNTTGATWATSQPLVSRLSGNITNKTVPLLTGTYLVKFIDSGERESMNPASVTNGTESQSLVNVTALTENDDYAGAKTNCTVSSTNLVLDVNETEMSYDFSDHVDLGSVQTVRVVPKFTSDIVSVSGELCSIGNVCDLVEFCGTQQDATISFEISETDDDPDGTPTWTAYKALLAGFYKARGIRLRVSVVVGDSNTRFTFNELSASFDAVEITETTSTTTSVVGETAITYTNTYYSGMSGTDVPFPFTQIIDANDGDRAVITSRTTTGFNLSVFNGTNRVAKEVTINIIGL